MNTKMFTKLTTVLAGTAALLLLSQKAGMAAAFTVTSFLPTGFSDEIAGITGYTIEDFEDTTLISGLSIDWTSPDLVSVSILPGTYNPSSQNFIGNAWDGNLTLNNTRQGFYLQTPISSTTTFRFANQPTSVGIGVSNLQFTGSNSSILVVNGVDFADFDNFVPTPVLGTTGRSIYIRLDANSNETINSIGIRGGSGDFLTFDRVAVGNTQSVPEPLTILGSVTAIGFGAFFKQKIGKKC